MMCELLKAPHKPEMNASLLLLNEGFSGEEMMADVVVRTSFQSNAISGMTVAPTEAQKVMAFTVSIGVSLVPPSDVDLDSGFLNKTDAYPCGHS